MQVVQKVAGSEASESGGRGGFGLSKSPASAHTFATGHLAQTFFGYSA